MQCPFCQSPSVVKNGKYALRDGNQVQHHRCKGCGKRFSQRTGTPLSRLLTPPEIVAMAMKLRGEGMGVRASSRVLDKSHATILRLAAQASQWSPPAPTGADVTLSERRTIYSRGREPSPPPSLKGGH